MIRGPRSRDIQRSGQRRRRADRAIETKRPSFGKPAPGAGRATEIRSGSRSHSEEGKTYPSKPLDYRMARHRVVSKAGCSSTAERRAPKSKAVSSILTPRSNSRRRGPQGPDPMVTLRQKEERLKREIGETLELFTGVIPEHAEGKMRERMVDLAIVREAIHERELQIAAFNVEAAS